MAVVTQCFSVVSHGKTSYIPRMAKQKKSARTAPAIKAARPSGPSALEQWAAKRPALAAASLFALLTVIFFGVIRPALFSPQMMIYGTDTMGAGVFFRSFYADFWRTHGTMPLWEPYIHGGMPFVDAMHGDIFYPAAFLQIIFPVTYALGLKLILHVFLAGLFMYFFLREWGLGLRPAALGGILYMFTPCLVSLFYPGHDGKIYVTALTPLAFLFLHRGTVQRRWSSFFAFGLVYAAMIFTAHIQMAYYCSWGLGLYFLFLLWDEHKFRPRLILRPAAAFIVVLMLAGGASAIQWLSPYFYVQEYSQRIQHTEEKGLEWSSSWSMHAEEVGSLLVPEFPGDNLAHETHTYWGQNYFKLNSEAVGLVAVFFALVTVLAQRRRQVLFFALLALLSLIYATGAGTPLYTLSFYLVPGVKKFRAPSMINFLFAFGIIAVAAWGVHQLDKPSDKSQDRAKFFKMAVIIAGCYTLITLVVSAWGEGFFRAWAGIFQPAPDPRKLAAIKDNTPQVITGLWISTIILWGVIGLIWARFNRALKAGLLAGGLGLLALVDLWRFDARFINLVNPDDYYRRTRLIDQLDQVKNTEGPFRTFLLPQTLNDNHLALYGLEEVSLTAMHGNHLLSYDNFVGRHETPQNLFYPQILDLLNVTRAVSPLPAAQLVEEAARAKSREFLAVGELLGRWTAPAAAVDGLYLYANPQAVPRVAGFFGYQVIGDHEQVLDRIKQADFPYRRVLLLEEEVPGFAPSADPATLPEFVAGRIVDNQINEFTVEIDMPAEGLVFLSENYYPAWRAEDNGRPLPVYRADYTFRAVYVPAGKQTIHFRFDNHHFNRGRYLSGVCLLLLVVGLVATRRWNSATPRSGTLEAHSGAS
jgi:hypothetical protein